LSLDGCKGEQDLFGRKENVPTMVRVHVVQLLTDLLVILKLRISRDQKTSAFTG